jgi:hypothetical protein
MKLHRTVIVAAAAVVAVSIAHPAKASITGATISTTQPSYSGTCPVTIAFTGSVTGTPGTAFTYSFNRFVNGVQQVVAGGTVTLSSGSYAVNDSIPISATTSAKTFDQIWVHNISGGQTDVYSNQANFSVTCGGPTPNPRYVLHQGPALVRPNVTLHSTWWGDREYSYKWTGIAPCMFERGTALPTNLFIGYDHEKWGDSAWLCHWNTYDRAFLGFDQNSLSGLNVTQALLTLSIATGDRSCLGGIGRALLTKVPLTLSTSTTFTAPYPDDGDFNWPTTSGSSVGGVTFDVTSIVQQWASGKMKNDGFVVRGRTEDNGSDANNDSCSLTFGTDGVLQIKQM